MDQVPTACIERFKSKPMHLALREAWVSFVVVNHPKPFTFVSDFHTAKGLFIRDIS
jgi:hypothetical protein